MKNSLSLTLSLQLNQKCEKKNAWGHSIGLFIVACHHIAITQMVCSHLLQTIKEVIHYPTEWSKKNKLYIFAITNLLAVYKQPHIKNGYMWFSLNQ